MSAVMVDVGATIPRSFLRDSAIISDDENKFTQHERRCMATDRRREIVLTAGSRSAGRRSAERISHRQWPLRSILPLFQFLLAGEISGNPGLLSKYP